MLWSLSKTANNMMQRSGSKTHFWSDEETRIMLNQLKDILQYMDKRKKIN